MPRYVAFLRGVSPMNAKMPELKRCFERLGFTDVKTLLSSGNVAFSAARVAESALIKKVEGGMEKALARSFYTIIRGSDELRELVDANPFEAFDVPPDAKRVVTFLREPHKKKPALPMEFHGARILSMTGREIFTAYVPGPRGPVFMNLIEKTFGADVTTRTWDTVRKCASA